MTTDDAQGEELVASRVVRNYPDWRTMEGMARGGESLTKALLEERAAERAHDDARARSLIPGQSSRGCRATIVNRDSLHVPPALVPSGFAV